MTLGGNLTMASGAALAFNFTVDNTAPVLALPAASTIPGTVNVKVSSADGIKMIRRQRYAVTSGFDFTGKTISVLEKPDWVTAVRVDSSGNLVK